MNKKLFDFLSSFGMMTLGLGLVFSFTLGINFMRTGEALSFPLSGERVVSFGGDVYNDLPQSQPTLPVKNNNEEMKIDLSAVSAVVIDDKTGEVLFEKNKDLVRPLASITKLMSAIVLMDLPFDWSLNTEIIYDDSKHNGSHLIQEGETFSRTDLWSIALIGSSNSAIHALARESGLPIPGFVELMNKKADSLSLDSLQFSEPTGLYATNQGSAYDVARLLKSALEYQKIKETLNTPEYYIYPIGAEKKRLVWSTNWLLTNWTPNKFSKNNLFGKTGYILNSDYNFVVSLEDKAGHRLTVSVLGASTGENRFTEARDLVEMVFDNYTWPDEEGYKDLVE